MPTYEYRRLTDGKVFEVVQKMSEPALTVCPETGDPVERLISASAFHLKGSGWYTTDYKGRSTDEAKQSKSEVKTNEASAEKPAGKAAEKTDGQKADTSKASGGCGTGCGHSH